MLPVIDKRENCRGRMYSGEENESSREKAEGTGGKAGLGKGTRVNRRWEGCSL